MTELRSTSLKILDFPKNPPPLAISLPLSGQHLIEASAGTGKTWTLTGIVLRLLIEEGYDCDHIIASTFTRSAAAEMRERIRGRLQSMQQLLDEAKNALGTLSKALHQPNQQGKLDEDKQGNQAFVADSFLLTDRVGDDVVNHMGLQENYYQQFMVYLAIAVKQKGLTEAFDDPINQYLIDWIAKQEFGLAVAKTPETTVPNSAPKTTITTDPKAIKPPSQSPKKAVNFFLASSRTTTALNQLDRLFVGTLDSLCQKWLQEFSADTGYQPNIQISNNVENIILSLIHDQLRAFRSTVGEHEPAIFSLMYATNQLPKAEDFLKAVQRALNFYSTPIDVFYPKPFELAEITALLEQIKHADSEALQPYLDESFRLAQGMKSEKLHTLFYESSAILKQVNQQGVLGLLQLSKNQKEWLEKVVLCVENGSGFKVAFLEQHQAFIAIPLIRLYAKLYQQHQALTHYMDDLNQYFHRFICQYVRDRLPVILEAQQITTFSLQLARLNHALDSKQGESLARYIRHQYPVALIDESQDINTEQAKLIQRIYLPNSQTSSQKNSLSKAKISEKNNTEIKQNKRQFLLLVGDPKQAIYGFRGGDVNNYNQIKAQFPQKAEELIENRRSAPAVIEALNHWFGKPSEGKTTDSLTDKGETRPENQQAYFLGEQIHYRHIRASRDDSDLFVGGHIDKTKNRYMGGKRDTDNAVYLLNIAYNQALPTDSHANENTTAKNPKIDKLETTLDFSKAVTAQILALIDSEHPMGYRDDNGKIRPLSLNDIGILADKNKQLDSLEQALQARNIPTSRGGSQSVFAGEMTHELIVLMQAMLYPYDMARLRRLLLSHFFGLSLTDVANYADGAAQEVENTIQSGFTPLTDIQQLMTEAGKKWQKSGFLTAIQWLLNQEVMLNHVQSNFWQRLARHTHENRQKSGERLLVDLRQLLDIISQLSQGIGNDMGEYQLLEWLEQQQDEPPKEEWDMQQRLPSEDAVNLMTIHNAKGLEFPIVFVVGLDKKINTNANVYHLYLYADDTARGLQNRKLSPVPHLSRVSGKSDEHYKTIENNAIYEEKLRLAYVALTRCRDRLYIVTQGNYKNDKDVPLNHWLLGKTFEVPEHLNHLITQVDINSLSNYFNPNFQYQSNDKTTQKDSQKAVDYDKWQATIKMTEFIGWTNTSFTALARHLQQDKLDVAINQPDYLFENSLDNRFDHREFENDIMLNAVNSDTEFDPQFAEWVSVTDSAPDNNSNDLNFDELNIMADTTTQSVRFTFEKGTNAGTFLHKILEILPPIHQLERDDDGHVSPQAFKTWTPLIDRAVTTHQIAPEFLSNHNQATQTETDLTQMGEYAIMPIDSQQNTLSSLHLDLATWLYEITQTPLLAPQVVENLTISLAHIPSKQKIAELSFDMSLKQDFAIEDLNALFKSIGITLNLNKQGQAGHYWRYLKGEIDLVYQAGERFFVVDYKSNYLGNQFSAYDNPAMAQAMDEHGYWLQAGIYQVALHRYLSLRLPNYRIDRHLGAVEYVFLRGMSPNDTEQGRLVCDKLTPDFIQKLDAILGNASMDDKLK